MHYIIIVFYLPQRNGYYGGGGGDGHSRGLDRTPSRVGNNRSFRVDFGSVEMNDRCNNSGKNGESNGGGGGSGNGKNARGGSDGYIGCYANSTSSPACAAPAKANSATRAASISHADCNKMGLSATPVSTKVYSGV